MVVSEACLYGLPSGFGAASAAEVGVAHRAAVARIVANDSAAVAAQVAVTDRSAIADVVARPGPAQAALIGIANRGAIGRTHGGQKQQRDGNRHRSDQTSCVDTRRHGSTLAPHPNSGTALSWRGVHLYRSNRAENLVDALAKLLRQQPESALSADAVVCARSATRVDSSGLSSDDALRCDARGHKRHEQQRPGHRVMSGRSRESLSCVQAAGAAATLAASLAAFAVTCLFGCFV